MTGKILSYSAGSTSRDPYQFRIIEDSGPPTKLLRLVETFSELTRFFGDPSHTLVIDGYPAALGGLESMTRVITYLHPPTCTRALELAAMEGWRSVFVAQPLAGAHLLLSALEQGIRWPEEILWATGGYPLPESLESFVRDALAEQNCQLTVLQAYGIAELDHTLLAATERDERGRPIYHLIDDELAFANSLDTNETGLFASLRYRGRTVSNLDQITAVESTYRIGGDPTRYGEQALQWLRSWQPSDWDQFTGFFVVEHQRVVLQRRHCSSIAGRVGPTKNRLSEVATNAISEQWDLCEMNHFPFIELHGMSWLEKPKWNPDAIKLHGFAAVRSDVAAAA